MNELTPKSLELLGFNVTINNNWVVAKRGCCCIESEKNDGWYFIRISVDHDTEEISKPFNTASHLNMLYYSLTKSNLI